MPLGCVILEGGGNAELRTWKAFGQWINTIRKAFPVTDTPEHARYAARKIVNFIQGSDTLSRMVMDDLSTTERWSLVEESTLLVLSFLKREGSGAQCCMLTERVRRLAERALHKGLEYSRRATHKWLGQALKGGAGPAHRWCGKEDARNGNVSGAIGTQSVLTKKLAGFVIFESNTSLRLMSGQEIWI